MSGGRLKDGSRFTYAVQLARSASLSVVHDPDSGELDAFSKIQGQDSFRRLTPPASPPNRTDMDAKLSGLQPAGSDYGLYDAIGDAADAIKDYRNSAAVLFTDGGSQQGDLAAQAKRLRGRLKGDVPPIIVLTGTQKCDSDTIKTLGDSVACVDTAHQETNDTIAAILDAMRVKP